MKALKIAALAVAGLFVLVTLVGFALPRTMRIERTASINAPPSAIYPLIANLKDGWKQWSPWEPKPETRFVFSGPAEGVGATMAWDSPSEGDGRVAILKADPQRGIEMEVSLMQEGWRATSSLLCEPAGQATNVIWTEEFDMGTNPYRRIMGQLIQGAIAGQHEQGLAKLKSKLEAQPPQAGVSP